jgi:hypothetical protein
VLTKLAATSNEIEQDAQLQGSSKR